MTSATKCATRSAPRSKGGSSGQDQGAAEGRPGGESKPQAEVPPQPEALHLGRTRVPGRPRPQLGFLPKLLRRLCEADHQQGVPGPRRARLGAAVELLSRLQNEGLIPSLESSFQEDRGRLGRPESPALFPWQARPTLYLIGSISMRSESPRRKCVAPDLATSVIARYRMAKFIIRIAGKSDHFSQDADSWRSAVVAFAKQKGLLFDDKFNRDAWVLDVCESRGENDRFCGVAVVSSDGEIGYGLEPE
jgi:hypothetical protein